MATDEEIRSLCARVIQARGKEFDAAVAELQSVIEQRLKDANETPVDEGK